ncbi:MAG TPA: stage IV sporulation protein A [Candidatus Borkfalkia excrementavium]|uniref:Stage IV sporulation protein A n=1 Tax=Candidatus Borkfalkia excrementavium TaxID=2838505 RepID=A0A9D2CGX9_9FIRM|nr:stage IV sporulation protein A [Candidatus Borkfalkia excrementavium]
MLNREVYEDIAERTGGDIYIGVVGPVRTGKSTFIRRFAEQMILPNMQESGRKSVLTDELPQAAEGRTVMTTEPKFVPGEAARVSLSENASVNVKLIDCVGFPVDGAVPEEDGKPRMVSTPWSDTPMPFADAAELGTQKVIREHATIAVMVTSDGTIADIPRSAYITAEERTVRELKGIGKPFVILLNSRKVDSPEVSAMCASLEQKYGAPVLPFDCEHADAEGFSSVLESVLFEFPVVSIDVKIPEWMRVLPEDNAMISEALEKIRSVSAGIFKMRDCSCMEHVFDGSEYFESTVSGTLRPGEGRAEYEVTAKEGLFYRVLSEECGADISDDFRLMAYVKSLGAAKAFHDKFESALRDADESGYGIVMPAESDLVLGSPELTRQGGRCAIRLKADAGSYHIIRVDVHSEVSPVVGDAAHGEEIVKGMLESYEKDPETLWNTDLFGRTFKDMVREGLDSKAGGMPEGVRKKMKRTVTRIVNEARGGVICILL